MKDLLYLLGVYGCCCVVIALSIFLFTPTQVHAEPMDDLKDYTTRMINKHTVELAKLELQYPSGHVKAYVEGKIMAYTEMQLIISLYEKKIKLERSE